MAGGCIILIGECAEEGGILHRLCASALRWNILIVSFFIE